MGTARGSWKVWAGAGLGWAVLLGAAAWWFTHRPPQEPKPTTEAPAPETAGPTLFRDMTAASGINFTYRNGQEANYYAILESLGGGVALIDFDGDGLLDVFLPGGGYFDRTEKQYLQDKKPPAILGHPCKLYKNLGHFQFRDVTAEVGLTDIPFYTHGCAVADYDRDGWPDLLVTGYGRCALFHNVPTEQGRRFREATREAGLLGKHFWSTSAAWADLDGDGYPDLYLCQYVDWTFDKPPCEGYSPEVERDVCPPGRFDARPHALYRNNGDGTFTDVSLDAGLHHPRREADYARLDYLSPSALDRLRQADQDQDFGKGLGVLIVDVNGDGKPDVYVANDTTDKFLYINQSSRGRLRFEDRAIQASVARDERGAPNGSMGVDAGDYDGSGRPSLLVTNYQNEWHALYRNVSTGIEPAFVFDSRAAGLTGLGRQYVGFGTGFLDLDGDGWQDVVIVNGHVIRYPSGSQVRQLPLLLHNEAGAGARGQFANVSPRGGDYFQTPHQGRGLAIGDLDNDGRPDLVISHVNEPVVLLRNESAPEAGWLGIVLADRGNRDVVGAKITLEVDGRRLTRFARGGGSYLSSNDRRHLFGLGGARSVGRLTVAWPWKKEVETWDGLSPGRYYRVTAGEKQAQELPGPDARGTEK